MANISYNFTRANAARFFGAAPIALPTASVGVNATALLFQLGLGARTRTRQGDLNT